MPQRISVSPCELRPSPLDHGRLQEREHTLRRTLKRDWRAAMKYLETRYRDQWGAKLEVDVTRQIQKTVILTAVPDELKPGAGEAWAEERARREAGYADAGSAAG